jgi:hypothetical protein
MMKPIHALPLTHVNSRSDFSDSTVSFDFDDDDPGSTSMKNIAQESSTQRLKLAQLLGSPAASSSRSMQPPDTSASGGSVAYRTIVRNTFLDAVSINQEEEGAQGERTLKKSASDSDLSRSSCDDTHKFWLPELSEQSSAHSISSATSSGDCISIHKASSSRQGHWIAGAAHGPLLRVNSKESTGDASWPFHRVHSKESNGDASSKDGDTENSAPGQPDCYSITSIDKAMNAVAGAAAATAKGAAPIPTGAHASQGNLVHEIHRATRANSIELQGLQDKGILEQIPINDRGEFSSVGSIRHHVNECSPCLFWFRNSCTRGIFCEYCHMKHKYQKNKRIRPSKKTRMLARAHAGHEEHDAPSDGEDGDDHTPEAAGQNTDAAQVLPTARIKPNAPGAGTSSIQAPPGVHALGGYGLRPRP